MACHCEAKRTKQSGLEQREPELQLCHPELDSGSINVVYLLKQMDRFRVKPGMTQSAYNKEILNSNYVILNLFQDLFRYIYPMAGLFD